MDDEVLGLVKEKKSLWNSKETAGPMASDDTLRRNAKELPVDNRTETCGRAKPRTKSQGIRDAKVDSEIKHLRGNC